MINWTELLKAFAGCLVACWLFFVFWRALHTGMIRFQGREYSRKEEPFSFWLLTVMAVVAGLALAGSLVLIYLLPG